LQELIERPRVERLLVSVWHGQALQAALIAAHDRVRGYFVHGVSADSPAQGATVLLHLATMQRLKERGVRCYDFGGVPVGEMSERLAGIARFKQRFGGKFEARARFTLILDDRGRRLGRALGLSEWK
jgi:lipid II:glycine glycyltransferase (peptidoglycan interpeptide bridge formation enzyme)